MLGEIEGFGKVIILAWVPALEDAGLDCIKIPSGSKVQISAYHSASSIYVQSCDAAQKTIRSEILQDVASCTKGLSFNYAFLFFFYNTLYVIHMYTLYYTVVLYPPFMHILQVYIKYILFIYFLNRPTFKKETITW